MCLHGAEFRLRRRTEVDFFNTTLVTPLAVTAATSHPSSIGLDVGVLQTRNGSLCYFPNPDIVTYAGDQCNHPLLSGALLNHIDKSVNPEAPPTAYYNLALKHLGNANLVVPPISGSYIACYQGVLFETDDRGTIQFHSWCRFAIGDRQISFADARNNGGVCSRVHLGGMRAERAGCVAAPKVSFWWITDTNLSAFFVLLMTCAIFCAVWSI